MPDARECAPGAASLLAARSSAVNAARWKSSSTPCADDDSKHGLSIHGVPVLGGTDLVRSICEQQEVAELLIAAPNLPTKRLRQIIQPLQGMRIRFRMIASMKSVIESGVAVSWTRAVAPTDYPTSINQWLAAIGSPATAYTG